MGFPKSQKDAASYVGGAAPATAAAADDDDDDVDLFGDSDEEEESEEAAKIRQERLDTYAAKSPRNPPSLPRPPCCSTANPGTTRPTWTQCSSPSRPSKWTALFGGQANLSLWATASINSR